MSTSADPMTLATMTATDALQTCTEACLEWQHEIARFVDLRLAENRRSLEAAMTTAGEHCKLMNLAIPPSSNRNEQRAEKSRV